MDQVLVEANQCNGIVKSIGVNCKEEVEEERETVSLLPQVNGDLGEKENRKSRRKVQWNDRNGNNLVQVMEFQPSDSSESEEDYVACCNCSIM